MVASENALNESMFDKKTPATLKDDDSEVLSLTADPKDQMAIEKLHVRLVESDNALILTT